MIDDRRSPRDWWRGGTIYQIYPRSYQDTNGDGVGDLPGIAARLDHLVDLGVDAVWVSPIFPSPMADFGYDVADYRDIHTLFGTLADFDRLLAAAHERGLRLLLDFVPNHSSCEHPWFRESASARDGAKRDWYVWRDPKPDGSPPTNWQSWSGIPAWTFHEPTEQYYLHKFLPEQPDLNWWNPDVRAAMLDNMRFWLERGIDGFRVDVLNHTIEDREFRDDPPNPDYRADRDPPFRANLQLHSSNRPEVMELVVEPMRRLADEYGALLVGETYEPFADLVRYYGTNGSGVQLPFNFSLVLLDDWRAETIAGLVRDYERALPADGWPNWVTGNHDQSRIATKVGPARARAAMMLLLTLRGTPTIYQGEEIGMEDVAIPTDAVRDPWELNMPGLGEGRDPCRTPMRWDASPGQGFTQADAEPWLPFGPPSPNVSEQRDDPASMLSLTRDLLRVRRAHEALSVGAIRDVRAEGDLLRYVREGGGERFAVAINLGDSTLQRPGGEIVLSTHGLARHGAGDTLRPGEGVILRA